MMAKSSLSPSECDQEKKNMTGAGTVVCWVKLGHGTRAFCFSWPGRAADDGPRTRVPVAYMAEVGSFWELASVRPNPN